MMKHLLRYLVTNVILAFCVFWISLLVNKTGFLAGLTQFGLSAGFFYGFHFLFSVLNTKYDYNGFHSVTKIFPKYFHTWLITVCFSLLVMIIFDINWISKSFLLVNIFGLLSGELVMVSIVSFFLESAQVRDYREIYENGRVDVAALFPAPPEITEIPPEKTEYKGKLLPNAELVEFTSRYFDLSSDYCKVLNTGDPSEVLELYPGKFRQIINIYRMDFTSSINRLLESINSRLPLEGIFMICSETMDLRKERIRHTLPPVYNRLYYFFDFILMRIFPSLPGGRLVYKLFTGGKRRVISRTEILGRLSASGFEIVDEKTIHDQFFVIAKKINLPVSRVAPSYGLLIHLKRIGFNGDYFKVYKLRTMFPYSEYIQHYIFANNHLDQNGKFRNDFRITATGKLLRKYWIDELPGLWNWIRGDMKLVGVRPLSKHFYSLYTPELQQKRIRFKPGLIPPFYADLPKSLEEIMASERKYLEAFEKSPLQTDLRYFFRAIYNILIKGAKSQ